MFVEEAASKSFLIELSTDITSLLVDGGIFVRLPHRCTNIILGQVRFWKDEQQLQRGISRRAESKLSLPGG